MQKLFFSLTIVLLVSGCATSPDKISAAYVSPFQYRDYDCNQIASESQRVTRRAQELYGQLNKTANNDNAQMAIGLVLFWPTLFFLEGGDGPEAAEYSRLKGERDALEVVAIQKNCDASIIPPAIAQKEPKQKEKTGTTSPSRKKYNHEK